jgi:hypothetical protein
MEVGGKAEMVESILTVIPRDGQKAGRGEAFVECVRKRIADPAEVLLPGVIFKGKDQNNASWGSRSIRALSKE